MFAHFTPFSDAVRKFLRASAPFRNAGMSQAPAPCFDGRRAGNWQGIGDWDWRKGSTDRGLRFRAECGQDLALGTCLMADATCHLPNEFSPAMSVFEVLLARSTGF